MTTFKTVIVSSKTCQLLKMLSLITKPQPHNLMKEAKRRRFFFPSARFTLV
jgi:hypothetical protein